MEHYRGTPMIHCKGCGYCLYGLDRKRCPECGREFDPADPTTYVPLPRSPWPRRLFIWGIVLVVAMGAPYAAFLGWLYMGWRNEAGARELLEVRRCYKRMRCDIQITSRPLAPESFSWLLPERFEWQDRIDTVDVVIRTLTPEQLHDIAECQHMRMLRFAEVEQPAVTDATVARLPDTLEFLQLSGCPNVTDASVPSLCRLTRLRTLWLCRTGITSAGVDRLRAALPGCRITVDPDGMGPGGPAYPNGQPPPW